MAAIGAFLERYGAKMMITGLVFLMTGTALHGVVLASENIVYIEQATSPTSGPSATVSTADLGQMVFIPETNFQMGSSTDGNSYDSPAHQTHVGGFWIRKYAVTNIEYKKFLDATGYPPPSNWNGRNYPLAEAYWPVTNVSWYDAQTYARWAGQELPTEAQWELAARGTQGYTYPWGNDWKGTPGWVSTHANTEYLVNHPTPVGVYLKGVSPYGLYDMAGDVWEWTNSNFGPYPGNSGSDWTFYQWQTYKVTRGGSYRSDYFSSRTAQRNPVLPTDKELYIGFRTIINVSGNTPPGG